MSLISEILPIDNIVLDNHSATKQAIFERAGLLFANKLGLSKLGTLAIKAFWQFSKAAL